MSYVTNKVTTHSTLLTSEGKLGVSELIEFFDNKTYSSSDSPKNGRGIKELNTSGTLLKNVKQEYDTHNSIEDQAAEIVISVIKNSTENLSTTKPEKAERVVIGEVKTKSLSESIGADEVMWKEIYENDQKKTHHGSSGLLNNQISTESTFYKRSQDNLNWEYLDFKAGTGHPRRTLNRIERSPDVHRKPVHGPFDSAYRKNNYDSVNKMSWKEIYENEKKADRSTSRNRLDLLDKNELSWKQIYENDYHFFKKETVSTQEFTEEAYQYDPKDFEPQPVIEKVIDSMTLDSSLVKKIPSKEKLNSSNSSTNSERTKSESFVSTKETATYHHQLSDQSGTQSKHVSVLVPNIINNRDSAPDSGLTNQRSRSASPNKIHIMKATGEPTTEQKQKILDELLKQSLTGSSKSPTQTKKVIEPAIVIPGSPQVVEQTPKSIVIVTQKSVETKIIGENRNCGVIKLTVHYDELRHRLSITCHQAQNLKNVEKKGVSDPYCRIYLVPDDKKSYKRKTKVVKENMNPRWEETFDYKLTYEQSIDKDLIVSLKDDKKGLFSKQETRMLGEVRLRIAEFGIKKPYTRWYFLQPLGTVSKLLLDNGINPYKK